LTVKRIEDKKIYKEQQKRTKNKNGQKMSITKKRTK